VSVTVNCGALKQTTAHLMEALHGASRYRAPTAIVTAGLSHVLLALHTHSSEAPARSGAGRGCIGTLSASCFALLLCARQRLSLDLDGRVLPQPPPGNGTGSEPPIVWVWLCTLCSLCAF
jgi:hypothetical protein